MKSLVVIGALLAPAAIALPAAAAADTVLHLAETAHVAVHPDQMVATLRAEAVAATPAAAQAEVNTAIGHALDAAHAVPAIAAATGFYQVWQQTKPTPGFHAGQSVTLTGKDGAAMLSLVGRLQAANMQLGQLGWQVSPPALRAAQSEAMKLALSRLRARAEEAAKILGLRFIAFRTVSLDQPSPPPPVPRMMAMAAAAPAPRAEAQDSDITATVQAEAVLVPAQP
ncbi:MAG: SIMPL domain-containing protein [Rhodospirillales bacterium]|nr:SIMPL domain-containing protein [Rhodospirillales bacterium]MDE2199463.1 SIMPL domain-containing protein [Rhodospirillales bacterium]MDE2574657.1 SIMPL domain-containing protein [Rhodospirillales bacterium]